MRAGALWRRAVRQSHDPTLRTDVGTYGWLEGQGTSARAPLAPLRYRRRRTGPLADARAANVLICYSGNGAISLDDIVCVCVFEIILIE